MFNGQHFPDFGLTKVALENNLPTLSNFCRWFHGDFKHDCHSYWRHGICMTSIYDLPFLATRQEYFVNKIILSHEPVAYQCLEERYDKLVEIENSLTLDLDFYCKYMRPKSRFVDCDKHPAPIKPKWS